MTKIIKYVFMLCGFLLLAGCAASLEDFQKMSSYERTEYVCKNHKRVRYWSSQVDAASQGVFETESAIDRGYKIHQSCKEVPVVKSLGEDCYYRADGLKCYEKTRTDYETVCEELPVAIDGDLEKEKLRSYRRSLQESSERLRKRVESCKARTIDLSAEEAFDYYQAVK